MREYPIIFSEPMVRAILYGHKTQTRRMSGLEQVNVEPSSWEIRCGPTIVDADGRLWAEMRQKSDPSKTLLVRCPYGPVGTRLWVREAWQLVCVRPNKSVEVYQRWRSIDDAILDCCWRVAYRATERLGFDKLVPWWRSPIHLPRRLSRMVREVTDIRLERVTDISTSDALAEGMAMFEMGLGPGYYLPGHSNPAACPDTAYGILWDQIHGPGAWRRNSWVWVVEFRRAE